MCFQVFLTLFTPHSNDAPENPEIQNLLDSLLDPPGFGTKCMESDRWDSSVSAWMNIQYIIWWYEKVCVTLCDPEWTGSPCVRSVRRRQCFCDPRFPTPHGSFLTTATGQLSTLLLGANAALRMFAECYLNVQREQEACLLPRLLHYYWSYIFICPSSD